MRCKLIRVSISLSSGFSFQDTALSAVSERLTCFNLVIERLLISGLHQGFTNSILSRFNLVIERLLISGHAANPPHRLHSHREFQSRYRAASHFRIIRRTFVSPSSSCFNLVIERLLISGATMTKPAVAADVVSISLSSGFSFQENSTKRGASMPVPSFNLVIERLLISGKLRSVRSFIQVPCFNLVIERLLISGSMRCIRMLGTRGMFQSRYRAASHFRGIAPKLSTHRH